jgi:hypothetical protein
MGEAFEENATMRLKKAIVFSLCAIALTLHIAGSAHAQAGPPFLTNDPGTPGNANWEINLGSMQTISRGVSSYEVPQIDLNFGLGDRIQLTYEVPYVLQSSGGQPVQSGWSNGYPGLKWRFLDEGEDGWQMSTFPQVETGASMRARQKGIAAPGPRYLLPPKRLGRSMSISRLATILPGMDRESGFSGLSPDGQSRSSSNLTWKSTTIVPTTRRRIPRHWISAVVTSWVEASSRCLWRAAASTDLPAVSLNSWATSEFKFS